MKYYVQYTYIKISVVEHNEVYGLISQYKPIFVLRINGWALNSNC